MQLLKMNTDPGLSIQDEIRHIRFKDLSIGGFSGKERDIEELIVRHPGLLNTGDFSTTNFFNDDLLIISRQVATTNRKRADLFAIDREGYLVIIEVKRDASDERGRLEGIEFQAIRYAAASRKMSIPSVIDLYADYLRRESGVQIDPVSNDSQWQRLAVDQLCKHLSDEDKELTETDLTNHIDPRKKQKIYLVAADYELHVTSACAWLREHSIDISCFRLRPYRIAGQVVLERERLIPPPELDDFMTDIAAPASAPLVNLTDPTRGPRATSNRPRTIIWSGEEENPVAITSWRALLEHVILRTLKHGISPSKLPVKTCDNEQTAKESYFAPAHLASHGIWVELHGSADEVKKVVRRMVRLMECSGLKVDTANGEVVDFSPAQPPHLNSTEVILSNP